MQYTVTLISRHTAEYIKSTVFVADRVYVAIASRDGKNQKELSVKAGDIVEVISWKFMLISSYTISVLTLWNSITDILRGH